jgi:hypothetical protein
MCVNKKVFSSKPRKCCREASLRDTGPRCPTPRSHVLIPATVLELWGGSHLFISSVGMPRDRHALEQCLYARWFCEDSENEILA